MALETVDRIRAGLVYDGDAQAILAGQGIASVTYNGVGDYTVVLSEELETSRGFPMAWAEDGVNSLNVGTTPIDRTSWAVTVQTLAGAAVDVPRLTWRLGALPVV